MIFGGSSSATVVFSYGPSGGIKTSSTVSYTFSCTLEQTFTYNISEGTSRFYRITGAWGPKRKVTDLDGFDDYQVNFVTNVQATSLEDLCTKLKKQKLLPVKKIEIFSDPVFYSDWTSEDYARKINTATDITNSVNLPDCLELFIDEDVTVPIIGKASVIQYYTYTARGSIEISNSSPSFLSGVNFDYTGEGILNFGGSAEISSSFFFPYTGSGNIVFGGSATSYNGSIGILTIPMESTAVVSDESIIFGFQSATLIEKADQVISAACCANGVTGVLQLKHDLVNTDKLSKFLTINKLTLPSIVNISYNKNSGLWRGSLYYRGLSINSTQESWNISFELGCMNTVATTLLASNVWKFALTVLEKDLSSGQSLTTRFLSSFDPTKVCSVQKVFNFSFSLNVRNGTVSPTTVQTAVFHDGIGLFKTLALRSNPVTNFRIAVQIPTTESPFVNATDHLKPSLTQV